MSSPHEITEWLTRWSDGHEDAEGPLMRLVLPEMRRVAARYLRRERHNHTLQATALVNEAYLRLIHERNVRWQDRSHFLAMAARVMRNILVDHARKRLRGRRNAVCVSFDEAAIGVPSPPAELLALSQALDGLAQIDARKARVVELRFFGGLTVEEAAAVLKIAPKTVIRDWSMARAWLRRAIAAPAPEISSR